MPRQARIVASLDIVDAALASICDGIRAGNRPFIAKDHGAYIGVVGNVQYFPGCNPHKDRNWYDKAHALFGGDDFGCDLPADAFLNAESNPAIAGLRFKYRANGAMDVVTLLRPSR